MAKNFVNLQFTGGVVRDTPASELAPNLVSNAQNVHWRGGLPGRILGNRNAYTTTLNTVAPGQLLHAINCEVVPNVNNWLLFEDNGEAWAITDSAATQIDAALLQAVPEAYRHTSALLNGLPIYSNGADEPVYFDGSTLVTLPGWVATESCAFIAVLKFHIFAMNISGPSGRFPELVKWSSAAGTGTVPTSWTPGPSNDSGLVELADSPGEIICAYPLGDNLIFYKRGSVYSATFVGGQNTFEFRKLPVAVGALAPRAVCNLGERHLVVTEGDIVLFDGATVRSIGEARVKRFLFNQIDQTTFQDLFTVYNPTRNEVLIAFPTSSGQFADKALIYDVTADAFGYRDLANYAAAAVGVVSDGEGSQSGPWATASGVWADSSQPWGAGSGLASLRDFSLVLVGSNTLNQQDQPQPVTIPASLVKSGITFGEPDRVKFVRSVHVRAENEPGELLVRVGGSLEPNGPITYSPEVTLASNEQIANVEAMGRYITVEIRSATDSVWRLGGLALEVELRGYH